MNTLKKLSIPALALLAVLALLYAGCKKDTDGKDGMTRMRVHMIDAPSPYNFQAINIDVQGLQVKINDEWHNMPVQAGPHNILELVNGNNVMLADNDMPLGVVQQVRLALGANNTINVNGQVHALVMPPDAQDGLTVDMDEPLGVSDFAMTIDFDAAHSIEVNNGVYELHPVLHVFTSEGTGSISGYVTPATSGIAIMAISQPMDEDNDDDDSNNHTGPWWQWYHGHHHHHYHSHHHGHNCGYNDDVQVYTAYADAETGEFLLQGLEPGSYTVKVYPANSDEAIVFYNVTVTEGGTVSLGTITIPQ